LLATTILAGSIVPFTTISDTQAASQQTTYKSGNAHFSTTFSTKNFHLPKKKLIMDLKKYASPKDGSFRIELRTASGKKVDQCIGDAYANKAGYNAKCYFSKKRAAGKYYLKFINETSGTTIHIPKYTIHD
jgi:hypothetical protein